MDIIHDTTPTIPAPTVNVPVPAVLTAAASLIAENGLSLDDFMDYDVAEAIANRYRAPVCAAGAIRIAYGYAPDDSEANWRCPALAWFADWLIRTQRVIRDREPNDAVPIIAIWNDLAGERGGADAVVAGLRQAATEAGERR